MLKWVIIKLCHVIFKKEKKSLFPNIWQLNDTFCLFFFSHIFSLSVLNHFLFSLFFSCLIMDYGKRKKIFDADWIILFCFLFFFSFLFCYCCVSCDIILRRPLNIIIYSTKICHNGRYIRQRIKKEQKQKITWKLYI